MHTAHTSAPTGRHIPALDGLRGLAILLVLMVHLFWIGTGETGNSLLRFYARVSTCGWIGVDLFFALSGFLITGILFDTLGRERYFRNFYTRRALRVFPLYYAFIALMICAGLLHKDHWYPQVLLFVAYIQNLHATTFTYTTAQWVNFTHFWSLALEEQFYLFWPFAVYLLRTPRRIFWAALGLAAASFALRCSAQFWPVSAVNPYFTYMWTPLRMETLLLGSALAIAVRSRFRRQILQVSPRVAFLGFSSLTLYACCHGDFYFLRNRLILTVGISILGVSCCALIASVLREQSRLARLFNNATLRFFGRYSYGLYVLHYTIIRTLDLQIGPALTRILHSHALGTLSTGLVALAGSVLLAYLSFEFFEQPFLQLKQRFSS